ncbi:MAG: hypothetical protein J5477_04675 [Schwartzia sp.]|nr:hypothetical protein [Schwartzia sp. (in: firmicutes)]
MRIGGQPREGTSDVNNDWFLSNSVWKEKLPTARNRCYISLFSGSFFACEKNEVKIFDSKIFLQDLVQGQKPYGEKDLLTPRQTISETELRRLLLKLVASAFISLHVLGNISHTKNNHLPL